MARRGKPLLSDSRKLNTAELRRNKKYHVKKSSKKFRFENKYVCQLDSFQCDHIAQSTGHRCKRRVVIGVDKCFHHLKSAYGVQIKHQSAEMGKGLFAAKDLKKGHKIPYGGQVWDATQSNKVYDEDATMPYAILLNKSDSLDAACQRWVGSLANHAPVSLLVKQGLSPTPQCTLVFILTYCILVFRMIRGNPTLRKKYRTGLILALAAPFTIGPIFKYFLLVPMPFEGLVVAVMDAVWYWDF